MHEPCEEVLDFWFPPGAIHDRASALRRFEWWFRGHSDAAIRERFAALHERAARGELDDWAARPLPRLALILVLDQFSRSLHRGDGRAFAQDAKALGLTLEGMALGHDAALETPWQKVFFYLPLEHSEDVIHGERCVELYEALAAAASDESRDALLYSAEQARLHRDVIVRFGRHPHRNHALGRVSTPEELDYLSRDDLVHLRPMPRP